jgi:hypothetical protein
MRRKIKRELFNYMSIHSLIRSLNVDVFNAYEDAMYYYLTTNLEIGEEDVDVEEGNVIETLFCVNSKRQLKSEEILDCFKARYSVDGEFKCELVCGWEQKKFKQNNVFRIQGVIKFSKNKDVSLHQGCFRKSYGLGYLKVVDTNRV